jgi:hypothetical protein
MQEIWKDIIGYEGLYQVSNLGRVKSFHKWKRASCPDEYILKSEPNNRGYHQVMLYKDGHRHKFLVHRLVASVFVPNPDNLPHINHIDEDISNNRASNLEWCTPLYNNCYGTAKFRAMITQAIPVSQKLINGQWLATYVSASVAQEITGISRKEINACIRRDLDSAGGFIWTRPD